MPKERHGQKEEANRADDYRGLVARPSRQFRITIHFPEAPLWPDANLA